MGHMVTRGNVRRGALGALKSPHTGARPDPSACMFWAAAASESTAALFWDAEASVVCGRAAKREAL